MHIYLFWGRTLIQMSSPDRGALPFQKAHFALGDSAELEYVILKTSLPVVRPFQNGSMRF